MCQIITIFSLHPPAVNLKEDRTEQDFNEAAQNKFLQENFAFCNGFETAVTTATSVSASI